MATTNAILDQAEQRVDAVQTTAHTRRQDLIEAMRDEIGRPHYQRAKDQLPEIERAIQKIYRPFLNQVATIAAKAKASLPAQVQGWLREMDGLCESIPRQVRAGIDGWDTLAPPIWTDGKSLDMAVRGSLVHGIRTLLNSWDGCLTSLKNLTGRVETFIAQSGWPSNQPGAPTMAPAPAREAEEITVEQDFQIGAKR
jgi:hypothetical protein